MKAGNAIEVNQVTKSFKVYQDKGYTLKELTLFSKRRKYEKREVLKGINFAVKKGEAVGLIGRNGCGKSTTLKLLTKIIYPDSGSIEMKGRVSSLIELGAGFHPDMSGRQNIYTNASIFGLTKKEIDKRMETIIEFSELREFIDNPVRTYSSGMYMRLAFSVAINVDADILLIDEILAVGDANFQAKCFNKLREIKAQGTTIVIVSHSLGQIEQICDRTIWINEGMIRAEGKPREIHPMYMDFMGQNRQSIIEKQEKEVEKTPKKSEDKKRWGNGYVRIEKIVSYGKNYECKSTFNSNESVTFEIHYKVNQIVKNAVIGIAIFRTDGVHCYGTNTRIDALNEYNLTQDGVCRIQFGEILLLPGEYEIDFAIESGEGDAIDYFTKAYRIIVYSERGDIGVTRLKHVWSFEEKHENN